MNTQSPPGWPDRVRPPGAQGWQEQAVAHLFDVCPPEFRTMSLLSRHPLVLAVFADRSVRGQQAAARDALAVLRSELDGQVEPQVVQAAVELWHAEAARLDRIGREVTLLRQALAGDRFVATMSGARASR